MGLLLPVQQHDENYQRQCVYMLLAPRIDADGELITTDWLHS